MCERCLREATSAVVVSGLSLSALFRVSVCRDTGHGLNLWKALHRLSRTVELGNANVRGVRYNTYWSWISVQTLQSSWENGRGVLQHVLKDPRCGAAHTRGVGACTAGRATHTRTQGKWLLLMIEECAQHAGFVLPFLNACVDDGENEVGRLAHPCGLTNDTHVRPRIERIAGGVRDACIRISMLTSVRAIRARGPHRACARSLRQHMRANTPEVSSTLCPLLIARPHQPNPQATSPPNLNTCC